jgi:hypothetical protein
MVGRDCGRKWTEAESEASPATEWKRVEQHGKWRRNLGAEPREEGMTGGSLLLWLPVPQAPSLVKPCSSPAEGRGWEPMLASTQAGLKIPA